MTISTTRFRAFLLVSAVALSGAAGCVSSDDKSDAKGGSTGTGGSTSSNGGSMGTTGGSTGTTGGSTGTGGTTSANGAFACPTPTAALITDFTLPEKATSTADASFGDFTTTFSGGTFVYPSAGTYPLTSDVSKDNWHVTGNVGDYSGLGLYFSGVDPVSSMPGNCSKFDASAFKGIQFTISGSTMGSSVTLQVGTAGDDVASSWLNAHKANTTDADKAPNFGRCMPVSGQYDGTCGAPGKVIQISTTPTVVKVLWAELLGGKPETTVNPTELTFISWILPNPAGVGTAPVPYMADVTIDDLQFIP